MSSLYASHQFWQKKRLPFRLKKKEEEEGRRNLQYAFLYKPAGGNPQSRAPARVNMEHFGL